MTKKVVSFYEENNRVTPSVIAPGTLVTPLRITAVIRSRLHTDMNRTMVELVFRPPNYRAGEVIDAH